MRMRYLSPLLVTLFGLLLSASAQEATSFAKARGKIVTRSYAVADLVVPVSANPMIHLPQPGATCAKEPCCMEKVQAAPCPASAYCAPAKACEDKATCEDRLIKLIQNTVCPQCWACNGGNATVEYYPLGMALIVNADPDVQEQVAGLLEGLQRLQDTCVALDVRVISVADGFLERLGLHLPSDPYERIGIDFNACTNGQPPAVQGPGMMPVAFLNDKQVTQFLEAIQGDQRTNVCAAPKVTMLNGQKAIIKVGSEQAFVTGMDIERCEDKEVKGPRKESRFTGTMLTVLPTISADHRTIQLRVRAEHSQLVPGEVPMVPVTTFVTPVFEGGAQGKPVPFTQYIQRPCFNVQAIEQLLVVPDGGTVVLGGLKCTRKVEGECAPPILSKVPYVNRLFKTAAIKHDMETLVILVTPRVIVQKQEAKQTTAAQKVVRPQPTPVAPPMMAMPVQRATYVDLAPHPAPVDRPAASFRAKQVAKLMEMYHEACAGGHHDEARKLAAFALELDPACFSKSRK